VSMRGVVRSVIGDVRSRSGLLFDEIWRVRSGHKIGSRELEGWRREGDDEVWIGITEEVAVPRGRQR